MIAGRAASVRVSRTRARRIKIAGESAGEFSTINPDLSGPVVLFWDRKRCGRATIVCLRSTEVRRTISELLRSSAAALSAMQVVCRSQGATARLVVVVSVIVSVLE